MRLKKNIKKVRSKEGYVPLSYISLVPPLTVSVTV